MLQDIEAARAQLAQYEADAEAIKEAISSAQLAALYAAREAVAEVIAASGFSREEVLSVDLPAPAKPQPVRVAYALKSDPSKVYTRGRMPAWLEEAMLFEKYKPESSKEREEFRRLHMVPVHD